MSRKVLAEYFSLNRRYSRSINLERDLTKPEALEGYVLTERAVDALRRIVTGLTATDANHAWTLTSVYGTGKSAFTHYLTSLCAPVTDAMRVKAQEIAQTTLGSDSAEYRLVNKMPDSGLFRAVATGAREPISYTIVRALLRGAEVFWSPTQRNQIPAFRRLVDLETKINTGGKLNSRELPKLVQKLAIAAETDVFLIIDELGKNLEYAAYTQEAEDLYILQQLAELPRDRNSVYVLGILHQAFAEYGQRLATAQRNEWAKIQGRFEDLPFTESAGQMMRLIEKVINAKPTDAIACAIHNYGEEWFSKLEELLPGEELTPTILSGVYPLHPLSALILPTLCYRYAQNDRSLFTFLTSAEPYALRDFIQKTTIESDALPNLKLDRVYDYFIESAGKGLAARPNLQRWVEVQDLIADARYLEPDYLRALKAIGILNLVTVTGLTRATRRLVTAAMCDRPFDRDQLAYWEQIVEGLLRRGLITHYSQRDELRIWQGSDFNIDSELAESLEKEKASLVDLLTSLRPLQPIVAQRHSYQTGTLRYFERHYLDRSTNLEQLYCDSPDCDGWFGYWLDDELPQVVPSRTKDGKPVVLLVVAKLDVLRLRTREYAALQKIQTSAPELQSDGVARREVRYRVVEAEQMLDDALLQAFDVETYQNPCWIEGKREAIGHTTDLNIKLSQLCDRVYDRTPILWNELINRRVLTSQGAKARRQLIEAMIESADREQLGLEGYGPEVSMYQSLLGKTGIHRQEDGYWGFYPPSQQSPVWTLWKAVEDFCLEAKEKPQTLDGLYQRLAAPPYGVKQGAIPVMVAALLLHHVDDVGVYREGTFIPVLGSEQFELLVKSPNKYAVKYFEVVGLRLQVFQELEAILRQPKAGKSGTVRNATLLTVVVPLYQFVSQLPKYTCQTRRISQEAQAVLQALTQTREPDELLFVRLPQAFGLPPIETGEADNGTIAKTLRSRLVQVLRELNTAYETLLSNCKDLLYNAFGVRSNEQRLREDLRVRANYLVGQCIEPTLRRFTGAATDGTVSDRQWLEALVMVVADKPAQSWTDEDATRFEIQLSDLARRFKNLEALQKEVATQSKGFEARRITITCPDGRETHRMVWVEHERTEEVEHCVDQILQNPILRDNPRLQHAVAAKLTERVLNSTSEENLAQIQGKQPERQDREVGSG